jgi:microcystin-dependent protein
VDPYVGEIRLFAGNYAPQGWAFCQGQEFYVQSNQVLYSIIGNMYGGVANSTFNLPDLSGCVPMHWGTGNGLTKRTLGQTGGESTVTLTEGQMPNHDHAPNCLTTTTNDETSPRGAVWSATPRVGRGHGPNAYSVIESVQMNAMTMNSVGGGQTHNNMQPYVAVNYIIALEGVYPPKS